MARSKVRYQSFADSFRVQVHAVKRAMLDEAALLGEGYAKANMVANDTIDTGFALNSIHAVLSGGAGIAPTVEATTNRDGYAVLRASEGLPAMDNDTSAVGCGAEYAIFVETRAPFLFPALDQIKAQFGGIVQKVKRR